MLILELLFGLTPMANSKPVFVIFLPPKTRQLPPRFLEAFTICSAMGVVLNYNEICIFISQNLSQLNIVMDINVFNPHVFCLASKSEFEKDARPTRLYGRFLRGCLQVPVVVTL